MSANTPDMSASTTSPGLKPQAYCCAKTSLSVTKPASASLTSTPVLGSPAFVFATM